MKYHDGAEGSGILKAKNGIKTTINNAIEASLCFLKIAKTVIEYINITFL